MDCCPCHSPALDSRCSACTIRRSHSYCDLDHPCYRKDYCTQACHGASACCSRCQPSHSRTPSPMRRSKSFCDKCRSRQTLSSSSSSSSSNHPGGCIVCNPPEAARVRVSDRPAARGGNTKGRGYRQAALPVRDRLLARHRPTGRKVAKWPAEDGHELSGKPLQLVGLSRHCDRNCRNTHCFSKLEAPKEGEPVYVGDVVENYVKAKKHSCRSGKSFARLIIGRNFRAAIQSPYFNKLDLYDMVHFMKSKDVLCEETDIVSALLILSHAGELRKHEVHKLLEKIHYGILEEEDLIRLASDPRVGESKLAKMLKWRSLSRCISEKDFSGIENPNKPRLRRVFRLKLLQLNAIRQRRSQLRSQERVHCGSSEISFARPDIKCDFAFVGLGYSWAVLVETDGQKLRAYLRCIRGHPNDKEVRKSERKTRVAALSTQFRFYVCEAAHGGGKNQEKSALNEQDMFQESVDEETNWGLDVNLPISQGNLSRLLYEKHDFHFHVEIFGVHSSGVLK